MNTIIPQGTIEIDTSHAIITPIAISIPNSCKIGIEAEAKARKPIEVVRLVKKMTLDISTMVLIMA